MRRRQLASAILMLSALCALTRASHAQAPETSATPILELDKVQFAANEQVSFWVGVAAPTNEPIPRSLWDTCRLTIVRPDGTEKIEPIGWPRDGMVDRGWRGGWGLGDEALQVGQYRIVFEFAGKKTTARSFVVEDHAAAKAITGEFDFPSPLVLRSSDARISLVIRNGSSEPIRFPHRGQMSGHVSVSLNKTTGERWGSSFFVPQITLATATAVAGVTSVPDKFTWSTADRVPTVTVAPGGTYRLELPLAGVLAEHRSPIPAGEFDLQLSTVLLVLVGQPNSQNAGISPVRLHITTTKHGVH